MRCSATASSSTRPGSAVDDDPTSTVAPYPRAQDLRPGPCETRPPWLSCGRCGWSSPTTTRSGGRACAPTSASNFHVVGEAGDADEAIEVDPRDRSPTSSCATSTCPNGGGIKVAKTCGEQTRIVMLTVSEAERDLLDAVAAGAVGYLVKSTPPDELRQRALAGRRRASRCSRPRSPSLVLGEFRRMAKAGGPVQPLSDREREVLQYVARGHTYREIGEQLFIAEKTVENHVRNILGKLHLNRKQELIRYALEHGIE